jgi:sortase A
LLKNTFKGLLVFALLLVTFLLYKNSLIVRDVTPKNITRPQASTSLPVRIQIPSLEIDSEIESVGIAPDGTMEVPSTPLKTAWYNLGVRPGDKGSAVIDGHVNWNNGDKGVFKDLHKIEIGSPLIIIDNQGKKLTFIVRSVASYNYNADATEIFTSKDDRAHLNLITCMGTWDKSVQSYSQRFIVFADLE